MKKSKLFIFVIALIILVYPFSVYCDDNVNEISNSEEPIEIEKIEEKDVKEKTNNEEKADNEEKNSIAEKNVDEKKIEEIQLGEAKKTESNSVETTDINQEDKVDKNASILYRTHIQNIGWEKEFVKDGETSGTSHQSKRLEAIEIKLSSKIDGGIEYKTHIQDIGWEKEFVKDGSISGTSHQSKRLEAIQIKLYGEIEKYYDVYYRVHSESIGWMSWAKNGESAGTEGFSYRLEAIEIVLVEKNGTPPVVDSNVNYSYRKKQIQYQTHVQNIGWQAKKYDGDMSGTSGQSKRLEAISISLGNLGYSGNVEYKTHVQNYGWMDWKTNGDISGTVGQSKRVEAIQIRLTGEVAKHYDIYYRVHAQSIGWMSWAKNGEKTGTSHQSRRLEAIEIVIVKKGENPPTRNDINTESAYIDNTGWKEIDGKKYYFYADGTKAAYIAKIDGKRYEFTANGELQHENIKLVADVSSHNQKIDWDSLWNSGQIDGAIVRISAGAEKVDSYFEENMKAITRLNIPYGIYIYSYAENYDEGKIYAQFLKTKAEKYLSNASLGVYFDLESNGITSYLKTSDYDGIVKGFMEILPTAKIYTYTNYSLNVLNSEYLLNLTTWIANYAVGDCPGNYRGWQYTSKGRVTGISTDVDLSIFYY